MNIDLIQKKYRARSTAEDDRPTLDFLKKFKEQKIKLLEAGAGLGRFARLVGDKFENIDLTCLEINENLHSQLKNAGFNSILGSVCQMPFSDNEFDVVHCSHVIEHLDYPAITQALDELFRVVKPQGFVIIKSPLMHRAFYNDIDHVRPYPPKTILQYFGNRQQQKTSPYKVKLIDEFHRPEPFEIKSNLRLINYLNYSLKLFWSRFGWPSGQASGYTAIFQKT